MKLITLNTHSLIEENYEAKLNEFVHVILREEPEVFALQEVNQSLEAPETDKALGEGYVPCKDLEVAIRQDNHAFKLAQLLREVGADYFWTWIPMKVGYGKYEEGLAIFSRSKIVDTRHYYISRIRDYNNWKTRKMLGIQTEKYYDVWFYTAHLGWWDDVDEPFKNQWNMVTDTLDTFRFPRETYYILGDFNAPDKVKGESYDYVKASGWQDTYELAEERDSGITVGHVIDGWHDRIGDALDQEQGMRLDYIWCDKKVNVKSSKVICNGINYGVVSDHYGVMIETQDD